MAVQSEAVLYRRLTETYVAAVVSGKDTVKVHLSWIADILDYLDANNKSQDKLHKAMLDDQPLHVIERFIKMREKENGETLGNNDDSVRGDS
jgi:hypothetical protein